MASSTQPLNHKEAASPIFLLHFGCLQLNGGNEGLFGVMGTSIGPSLKDAEEEKVHRIEVMTSGRSRTLQPQEILNF